MSQYSVLAHRDFGLYLLMRFVVTFAMMMLSLAVSWQVYDLTHDPLALGLVGLAEAVPAILVSLWAGHIADKYNRRSIMLWCIVTLFICALLLLFATSLPVELRTTQLTLIYFSIFLSGLARGFYSPAYTALLPQLVDRSVLSSAISWNSAAWESASVTGLSVGGLLYGFGSAYLTYCVLCGLLIIGFVLLLSIRKRPNPEYVATESAMVRIKEGIKFVRSSPLLLSAALLDMLAVLFGGAVALLPIFAKEVLHVGPEGLGILRASVGLGAIVMSVFLAHRRPGRNAGRLMLGAVAGFGVSILGFGLSKTFAWAFFFLFLSGMLDGLSVFVRAALVQHLTPDHMKGRVTSINKIFITSSNEIGGFESGLTAKLMGTIPAILFGGFACILIVGGFVIWAPSLRNLDFRKLEKDSVA